MAFQGCTAISCVRHQKYNRTSISYLIESTCRYAIKDICTYRRSRIEVARTEPKAQESVGVTTTG
jgi:hypothetical protein